MDFVERLKEADQLLGRYMGKALEVGSILSRVLSEVLGIGIDYWLGDDETGPDFIWLVCDEEEGWRRERAFSIDSDFYMLYRPIEEVFPELHKVRFCIGSCIRISPEEYERVKEALRKLREGKEG